MLKGLWNHLSDRRKKQFALMQVFIIIATVFEMASLGAVIPFLTVLSDPDLVYQYDYLQPLIASFEITKTSQLALPLTIIFISLIILSALVRVGLLWALTRLSYTTGADLCINIYRTTLYQDYEVHVSRNSSEVINGIITKTRTVTTGVINPLLNLISSAVTILGILIVLLIVNVHITLLAFIGYGGLYLIVIYSTSNLVNKNSHLIASKSDLMIKSLQEGLEGIREVLINNNQNFYTQLYKISDLEMRQASWRNDIVVSSPRFGMEAFGIAIIAVFAYAATLSLGGIDQYLPILGAFVLGAQKLLPMIQKAYGSYSRIKGSKYSLIDVIDLLDQPMPKQNVLSKSKPIPFKHTISLDNVSFRYGKDSPWIIKNIDLKIRKGSVIGIIGTTGCGKSTLLDILMALLSPTEGQIKIDDVALDKSNKETWQAHISTVPQHIYISDGTVEENIAFGFPENEIDLERVKKASKIAQISEFIEGLENGYKTKVGERGMKLSGGQRQRVGIARAFYKQSDVLLLDEATSALDDKTEHAVMSAIENHNKEITVIIIAHRLTTLKNCDQILRLGKNYKSEILSYEDVMNNKLNTEKDDAG